MQRLINCDDCDGGLLGFLVILCCFFLAGLGGEAVIGAGGHG